MSQVAVLFARSDSIYKSMSVCDVFDMERDALTFYGGKPVVAHPPCRAWGRLRKFARPRFGEKDLALFAVDSVINNGGVLEHPAASSLFRYAGLPGPGQRNKKGFTIQVSQHWFGHKAEKSTWLFISGIEPREVRPAPLVFAEPEYVIAQNTKSVKRKKEVSKADRERTPPQFADFLIDIAIKTLG